MNKKVISELKRIANEHNGILQPETVVERARPASSPLHSRFQWDNSKAAHQYRIWQARQLISVSVEMLEGDKGSAPVFVSLKSDRQREHGGYRILTDVLSDAQMREQMLHEALEELNCFQLKYQKLKQLSVVFKAVRQVRRKAA